MKYVTQFISDDSAHSCQLVCCIVPWHRPSPLFLFIIFWELGRIHLRCPLYGTHCCGYPHKKTFTDLDGSFLTNLWVNITGRPGGKHRLSWFYLLGNSWTTFSSNCHCCLYKMSINQHSQLFDSFFLTHMFWLWSESTVLQPKDTRLNARMFCLLMLP